PPPRPVRDAGRPARFPAARIHGSAPASGSSGNPTAGDAVGPFALARARDATRPEEPNCTGYWLMPAFLSASGTLPRLLISTAVLVIAAVVLHHLAAGYIRRNVQSPDLRRRWLVRSRNGIVLLLLLGLVMVWGEELRTIALSIVAIAVAFVVATKELILCLMGTIVKTVTRPFNIGDRIQIKDLRGDVIDQNLLTTTILEGGPGNNIHQRTGRVVIIPNALFLSEPVINESYTHDYILHVFTIPFKREDDWRGARKALLEAANRHCAPYLDDVRRYM